MQANQFAAAPIRGGDDPRQLCHAGTANTADARARQSRRVAGTERFAAESRVEFVFFFLFFFSLFIDENEIVEKSNCSTPSSRSTTNCKPLLQNRAKPQRSAPNFFRKRLPAPPRAAISTRRSTQPTALLTALAWPTALLGAGATR